MRSSGTGATSPGPPLPAGEGSGPPGLDRWAAPPVWPLGARGAGGVCVCVCLIAPGGSLGNNKGTGVRRLRVDGECGQRSTWARVELPKSDGWGAGRGWPSWEPLNCLGPRFYSKRKHFLF